MRPSHRHNGICAGLRFTRGTSQDCTAWRYLDGGNPSAIENHEPLTMSGAKHASVRRKYLDDFFDDLVLVDHVVLIRDVELAATDESNAQHYLGHVHAP
jgi:hypothetical protein